MPVCGVHCGEIYDPNICRKTPARARPPDLARVHRNNRLGPHCELEHALPIDERRHCDAMWAQTKNTLCTCKITHE